MNTQETLNKVKEGAEKIKSTVTSPETRDKAKKALATGLSFLTELAGIATYAATTAVLRAKDGVVDAVKDNQKPRAKE
jgi:hypothetical protein